MDTTKEQSDRWHNLGLERAGSGDLEGAFDAFGRALRLVPRRSDALFALGDILRKNEQQAEALRCYQVVSSIDPSSAHSAHLRIAQIHADLGNLTEAATHFQASVECEPDCAEAWLGLGYICEDQGHLKKAEDCYRHVLNISPGQGFAISRLLSIKGADADAWLIDLAQSALTWNDVPDEAKALVGYGLGKVLEARGQHTVAFSAYTTANVARRKMAGTLDRNALSQRISLLMREYLSTSRSWPYYADSDVPIFIVGMPRSGTTLTEQILSAHTAVHAAGELPDIAELALRFRRSPTEDHESVLRTGALDYLQRLLQGSNGVIRRATDKAPLNFFHLGFVSRLFPNARVIHCTRDPRDVCMSIYAENFATTQLHATDLRDLAWYWGQYRRLMAFWMDNIKLPILECRYEETVEDLESAARRLCEFTGIEFQANCLQFHANDRPIRTPSRWQVRRPIYRGSVGRWKKFESELRPLCSALRESEIH